MSNQENLDIKNLKLRELTDKEKEIVSYFKNFIKKTIRYTKPFKKIAKKMNGNKPNKQKKIIENFVNENLRKHWDEEIVNTILPNFTLLSKEEQYTYIAGAFIIANSQRFKEEGDHLLYSLYLEILEKLK